MAEQHRTRLVGQSDLGGAGGGMQVMLDGQWLYVGHLKDAGTSILDVSDPTRPRLVRQLAAPAHTVTPKVQLGDGLLLINYEQRGRERAARRGFSIHDLGDPTNPRELAYYDTGGRGIHRMWFDGGRYAYVSAHLEGFRGTALVLVDIADPARPVEAGRWWIPGTWEAGGEITEAPPGLEHKVHHAIVRGDRAYVGCWDAGLAILDVSDKARPQTLSWLRWAPEGGGCTHTVQPLPERGLLVVTDEAVRDCCQEPPKRIRIVDASDERNPRVLATCPPPEGDYCQRGGWSGPHNLHEHRPGTYYSDRYVVATYFNGGLRVYDIAEPWTPREVAAFVPDPPAGQRVIQFNDLVVDPRGLVYATDRWDGGLYVIEVEVE